jgi:hypothetical protein
MNRHPYLRAYMSGALLPTWLMMIGLAGFVIGRLVYRIPVPVERVIAFPMAVVPNLWGLWNVLYLALDLKRRIPFGAWGALLPLVLIPSGLLLEEAFEISLITPVQALAILPVVAGIYYLVWKHIVGFFNGVAGVG